MKTSHKLLVVFAVVALLLSCEDSSTDEKPVNKTLRNNARLATAYSFDGTEGDPIALEVARSWVNNFQEHHAEGTVAHFFGNEILRQILAEEGCVGIRMYYAIDENGERQLILVGVNAKGENLLPSTATGGRVNGDETIVADMSVPCPSYCPGSGTSL